MSGTLGAFASSRQRDRQAAAYWIATPGFIGTWVAGYLMAETRLISLGSPWISASMLLSLASLALMVWSVEKERRGRLLVGAIALGALIASTGTMVWKMGGTMTKSVDDVEEHP